MPQDSPAAGLFESLDRAFAQQRGTTNQVLQGLLGRIFAEKANASSARQAAEQFARRARPRPASQPPSSSQPPPPAPPPARDAREILGFAPGATLTKSAIKARQRGLAGMFHPDRGGSLLAMQEVNRAADELLAKLP